MSKFLDELQNEIHDMNVGYITNNAEIFGISHENINNMVDSLGENARRLLEIGIVQDRLVELGFTPRNGYFLKMHYKDILELNLEDGALYSYNLENLFFNIDFKSQRWQEDLINKVKELIECNN